MKTMESKRKILPHNSVIIRIDNWSFYSLFREYINLLNIDTYLSVKIIKNYERSCSEIDELILHHKKFDNCLAKSFTKTANAVYTNQRCIIPLLIQETINRSSISN